MTRDEFVARSGIIGETPELREIIDVALNVAPTDLTVLITGESGTGKEVFAQAIHAASLRARRTFVAVNCGAIPETLLESELFGHERGAYTGAHESRKGYFEQADAGTLFLDEIGDTPLTTQVKLLRALETGDITPVGAAGARRVNVRVIAATNRDLEFEVRRGAFRQDLFFRLRAVRIHLPPLRERSDDIPLLADVFGRAVCDKHGIQFHGFELEAMRMMQTHAWSGNVRELKNLVETMLVLEKGARITSQILGKYLLPGSPPITQLMPVPSRGPEATERELVVRALLELRNEIATLRDVVEDLVSGRVVSPSRVMAPTDGSLRIDDSEKQLIAEALRRTRFNRRRAAAELGISERTLYRKITRYHLLDDEPSA